MIQVTPDPSGTPLRRPWKNAVAVGRAYELLRDDLLSHLAWLQEHVGFRYCRFHALFHDDMNVVHQDEDGKITYQWHHVDKVYDNLLKLGLKPFVELNPMPAALASTDQKMFHFQMNVSPPRSYDMWGDLVEAFARHCVDRYGIDEVRQWYFEVWNEPNLRGFWDGDQADYWKLYDASARALKRVDAQLRVGGPATSKASWITDLIDHCVDHDVPLDFISSHLYPQDEYVDYQDRKGSPHALGAFFVDTVKKAKQEVAASRRPDLTIHWTEWNAMSTSSTDGVSWVNNPTNDSLYSGAFVADACIKLDQTLDTQCFWVASDIFEEAGIPSAAFSCTYGLLTIHGYPKSSANAFMLMNRLEGRRCEVQVTDLPAHAGVAATESTEAFHALLWHRDLLETDRVADWEDEVCLPAKADKPHVVVTARIAEGAGSAWETWRDLGRPHNLSRIEHALIEQHSRPAMAAVVVEPVDGQVRVPVRLGSNEVLYVESRPVGDPAVGKGWAKVTGDAAAWDKIMGEKSR